MANSTKIAISIDSRVLKKIDRLVKKNLFTNRSKAIQTAVEEKIAKLEKSRLSIESAKLKVSEEQSLAEEGLIGDSAEWPEY